MNTEYWDGIYTHIHWAPGQSAQDTETFCGLNLWLWTWIRTAGTG